MFHCYATIRFVERGRRYVIKSRLVKPLELCEKALIVEKLVSEARRMGVHICLLLLDKGFYSHEVIRKLKALRVNFLTAVPKNKRVKEAVTGILRNQKGAGEKVQPREDVRDRLLQPNDPQAEEEEEEPEEHPPALRGIRH